MVRQLVPLHEPIDPHKLPRDGSVTIGRRWENHIVCRDISVSGLHCTIVCKKNGSPEVEVVDCSSNGTFVNNKRLTKGQRQGVIDGDIISLMKPPMEGIPASQVQVQYRLEICPGESPPEETPEDLDGVATDLSLPSVVPAPPPNRMSTTAEGFAHDLLIQEQQSKAKITGELLLARRRLDEERTRSETLAKELRKAKATLDDERNRRTSAQEARNKLLSGATQLRIDRTQLQELRTAHGALQSQHDSVEVELTTQVQRAVSLEAAQERARSELERAQASSAHITQQLEEVQARLQNCQENVERLDKQRTEEAQAAEAAQNAVDQRKYELSSEKASREQLQDQLSVLRSGLERAEQSASAFKEMLATADAQHEELEARATRASEEAEAARASSREAQRKHEKELEKVEDIRVAAMKLAEGLRVYVEQWARGITDACSSDGASTFCVAGTAPFPASNAPSVLEKTEVSAGQVGCAAFVDIAGEKTEEVIDCPHSPRSDNTATEAPVDSPRRDAEVDAGNTIPEDMAPPWSLEVLNDVVLAGSAAGAKVVSQAAVLKGTAEPENVDTSFPSKRRRLAA